MRCVCKCKPAAEAEDGTSTLIARCSIFKQLRSALGAGKMTFLPLKVAENQPLCHTVGAASKL